MNTRAAVFLAIGTCGAGFLAAWLISRSDGTRNIDDTSSPVEARGLQREAPQVRGQSETPDLERPDSRVPAFTERPPEPAPAAVPAKTVAAPATSDPSDPRTYPERTVAEMEFKREQITKLLIQKKRPIVDQRFEGGQFEHVQDDPVLKGGATSEWERHTIFTLRMGNGRGIDRVVLSREEFPELYVFKDEEVRLGDLIRTSRVAEAEQAMPK